MAWAGMFPGVDVEALWGQGGLNGELANLWKSSCFQTPKVLKKPVTAHAWIGLTALLLLFSAAGVDAASMPDQQTAKRTPSESPFEAVDNHKGQARGAGSAAKVVPVKEEPAPLIQPAARVLLLLLMPARWAHKVAPAT